MSQLGSGGFATVYRAVVHGDMGFERDVALKVLHPHLLAANPGVVAMLADEARLLARMRHPGIVSAQWFGALAHPDGGSVHALVMDYVQGRSLESLLSKHRASGELVPLTVAIDVHLQLARALAYAHTLCDEGGVSLQLAHRDLKPDNVLLAVDGSARLLDFGIAKATDRLASSTETDVVRGTVRYMSPEQVRADRGADFRSDLFSFGAMLWEALVGRRLFEAASPLATVYAVAEFDPAEALHAVDDVFPAAVPVLARLLAPDPDDRFEKTQLVVDALESLRSEAGGGPPGGPWIREHVQEPTGAEATLAPTLRAAAAFAPTAEAPTPALAPTEVLARGGTLSTADLSTGELSPPAGRRRVVALLVAVLVLVLVAGLLVRSGRLGQAGFAPTDRVLAVGLTGEWGAFDLQGQVITLSRAVLEIVAEPLVYRAGDDRWLPATVGAWTMEDEGRQIRLRLLPDLVFHPHPCTGPARAATPADLLASIELAAKSLPLNIAGARELGSGESEGLSGLRATSDGVVITLDYPSPYPLNQLESVRLVPHNLAECEDPDDIGQVVGTGPFASTGPLQAESLALGPGASRLAGVGGLVVRPLPDGAPAAFQLVAAGTLDLALVGRSDALLDGLGGRSPELRPAFLDQGVRLTPVAPAAGHQTLALWFTPKPDAAIWGTPNLRGAVGASLDRAAICAASPGECTPTDRYLLPRMLGFDPNQPGFASPVGALPTPSMVLGTRPEDRGAAELIASAVRGLGIEVELQVLNQQTTQRALAEGSLDALFSTFFVDSFGTDPYPSLVGGHGSSAIARDPVLADLSARAARELDRRVRGELYGAMEARLFELVNYVPVGTETADSPAWFWLHREDVRLPQVDPVTGWTAQRESAGWWRDVRARTGLSP